MKHVISCADFDRQILSDLFMAADNIELLPRCGIAELKVMVTLFHDPSTRTRMSFERAMLKLNGKVISSAGSKHSSSSAKGESIEDMVRVVAEYGDILVLRHPEVWSAKRAAAVSKIPVINAGDGTNEHPTQALIDAYTIEKHHKRLDGLRIVVSGDVKRSRSINSLIKLFCLTKDTEIRLVSPPTLAYSVHDIQYAQSHGVRIRQFHALTDALAEPADVVYLNRFQKEWAEEDGKRIKDSDTARAALHYDHTNDPGWQAVCLQQKHLDMLPPTACVMNPLPRREELPSSLDKDERIICFQQAANGVKVRTGLIHRMLKW